MQWLKAQIIVWLDQTLPKYMHLEFSNDENCCQLNEDCSACGNSCDKITCCVLVMTAAVKTSTQHVILSCDLKPKLEATEHYSIMLFAIPMA